jgi:hypothetical protein
VHRKTFVALVAAVSLGCVASATDVLAAGHPAGHSGAAPAGHSGAARSGGGHTVNGVAGGRAAGAGGGYRGRYAGGRRGAPVYDYADPGSYGGCPGYDPGYNYGCPGYGGVPGIIGGILGGYGPF